MNSPGKIRTTKGRGRLFDGVIETIGDTPSIRLHNIEPKASSSTPRPRRSIPQPP